MMHSACDMLLRDVHCMFRCRLLPVHTPIIHHAHANDTSHFERVRSCFPSHQICSVNHYRGQCNPVEEGTVKCKSCKYNT